MNRTISLGALGLALVCALPAQVAGSGEAFTVGTKPDTVVALTAANFDEALKDPANPFWFLKFFAPW